MSAQWNALDTSAAPRAIGWRQGAAAEVLAEMNYLSASKPAHGLGPVVQVLDDHGISADGIFVQAGIPRQTLMDTRAPVDYERVLAFLEGALAALGRPDTGLLAGQHYHWGLFGAISLAGSACPNLLELYRLTGRYPHLIFSFARACVIRVGRSAVVRTEQFTARPALQRYLVECDVTCGVLVLRQLLPPSFAPIRVRLPFRAGNELPYRRFFDCPLEFDSRCAEIVFDASWLDHRLPGADAQVRSVFENECRLIVQHMTEPASCAHTVRRLLQSNGRMSRLEAVARSMGLTVRAVQRRLAVEGTTFSAILREERLKIAREHLLLGSLPLSGLALRLGFEDAVAFSHAFKDWTGQSPSEFRARHRAVILPPRLPALARPPGNNGADASRAQLRTKPR